MASPIDISFLSGFLRLFLAIFVFVFIYAFLKKINIFGKENNSPDSIYALISLFMAFIFITSDSAYLMLKTSTPWFIVLFIFLILGVIPFMLLGATESDITTTLKEKPFGRAIITWVIIIMLIIILAARIEVSENVIDKKDPTLEDNNNNETSSEFWENTTTVLTNKKILSTILFLLIAYYLVYYIAKPTKRKDTTKK